MNNRWMKQLAFAVLLSTALEPWVAADPGAPLPENAATQYFAKGKPIAPLQIVTSGDAAHYLVKLSDWKSGKSVLTVFVRSGQTADIEVPLGSYRLKYAAGQDWLGEEKLFGDETQFFEADKKFDFARTKRGINGYYVELILQSGGNLSTRQIPKGAW